LLTTPDRQGRANVGLYLDATGPIPQPTNATDLSRATWMFVSLPSHDATRRPHRTGLMIYGDHEDGDGRTSARRRKEVET
jgi:hypothetical protein